MSIYLTSDWHLITCQWGRKPQINIRLSEIMGELDKLTNHDTLIFMGDFMDDTVTFPIYGISEYLDKLIEKISVAWRRIFIRGNNDVMGEDFYHKLGFNEVCWAQVLKNPDTGYNTLISHTSVDLDDPMWINVHGHIHRAGVNPDEIMYYHNPENCINLCTADHREHRLTDIDTISYDIEKKRNNMWSPGQEKPGMSRLCQNMAMQTYLNFCMEKRVH